jgi:signal transduction histidine kinase
MSQHNEATNDALKLSMVAPVRLVGLSLVLSAIALIWFAAVATTAGGSVAGPFCALAAAVMAWTWTLVQLRRWRSEDREAHRRLADLRDRLQRDIAALNADIERRAGLHREMEARISSLEATIGVYEPEAQRLRASTEQALTAERKAIDGERAKAEYLARMCREIRSPLTTILGFTQTLVDMGDVSKAPPDRLEALFTIKQEGQQLLDTIDDTLELCAIELQKCEVSLAPCSLVEIVNEVYRLLAGWAEARGLGLLIEYVSRVPETINTDPERLSHILINLLGNAIKFTVCGDVRLKIGMSPDRADGSVLWFEVLDSGIGMHKDEAGRLFGGFGRAASDGDRRRRGSGLGLTISKNYAEMLGGDIVVMDTMPGIGTRIRFSIRVGRVAEDDLTSPERHLLPAAEKPSESPQDDAQPAEPSESAPALIC